MEYILEEGDLKIKDKKDIDDILKENLLKAIKDYIPEIKNVQYVEQLKKEGNKGLKA